MQSSDHLLHDFNAHLLSVGKSKATREAYAVDARHFQDFLLARKISSNLLSVEIVEDFKNHLMNERNEKSNSMRRTLLGVRQWIRFLGVRGILDSAFIDRVIVPSRIEEKRCVLDESLLQRIVEIVSQEKAPLRRSRDLAIVSLLAFEGMKASEIVHLKWSECMFMGDSISIHILGTRTRMISLSSQAIIFLKNYREEFKNHLSDDAFSFVFVGLKGRNTAHISPHFSRHGLKFLLYEIGEKAKVPFLNSEEFRQYAIQFQLKSGKTLEGVLAHFGLRRPGVVRFHVSAGTEQPLDVISPS